MNLDTDVTFRSLPGLVINYAKVIGSKKPLLAPGAEIGSTRFAALRVPVRQKHLARYRRVCGIPDGESLPYAFPHVLAMPLHMHIFTARGFPVKVLGLIHLRNTIRVLKPIPNASVLSLIATCDSMRETPIGQEFDIVTRCEIDKELVWEEVATMLARRAAPGQRPTIERAGEAEVKTILPIPADTGRRYARVSGDFNPIHLTARTASWFGFKQAVAHGMWSMSRSLGAASEWLPSEPVQIDTQFKLPLYLPSDVIFRCQRIERVLHVSLSSGKGDRMHLATQVRAL